MKRSFLFLFSASYLNCANLLNLAPEIVHRFFNAYQTYLPREGDFVDVVERWKIREALVDDKPERLLDTLHATNRDLYQDIYSIISILLAIPVSSATSDISFSALSRVKSYLRATMDDERLLCIYTYICIST
jgi:hypothetical protein